MTRRAGFTLVELTAASSLTVVVLSMVATLAAWNYRDRAQQQARQVALEAAANVLEEARATPWEALTPAWAAARALPDDPSLPAGKLTVTVADEANEKGLKRVVAKIAWGESENARSDVELVGFVAARPSSKKGGAK